ncbi:hypothetical protein SAMCFNEI73_pC0852 (plasmid) [Sinorhizobium americanum]|uniref:Uncharacterized protein n=1 Tax=Sinorhizobium americanum TaxID=194963 RepID=A0A1L3LWT6_9HYPH|nr:hypothetical protein SAMCFNEI73_pC0852 [Sinorhizobium americanum]
MRFGAIFSSRLIRAPHRLNRCGDGYARHRNHLQGGGRRLHVTRSK